MRAESVIQHDLKDPGGGVIINEKYGDTGGAKRCGRGVNVSATVLIYLLLTTAALSNFPAYQVYNMHNPRVPYAHFLPKLGCRMYCEVGYSASDIW